MKKAYISGPVEIGRLGNRGRKKSPLLAAEKQPKKQTPKVGSQDCLRTGSEQPIGNSAEVGRKATTSTELYASLRRSESSPSFE